MKDFPVDLIQKIFIRIPIKTLLKLRCVSKSWCKIIDGPFFAHMQYDSAEVEDKTLLIAKVDIARSLQTTLCLYAASENGEGRIIHAVTIPVVKFLASRIDGSCNGLVYFAEDFTGRILVSNPLKGQFRILPPMHIKMYDSWNSNWSAIGLGFDRLTKTFKMVCSNKRPSSSYFTLVHTLGTTSWREVSSVPAYYRSNTIDYKSVFVHGFLHWMMDPFVIDYCEGRILAFDVSKEIYKVIPHPEIIFEGDYSDRYFRILDIKGNLCMFDLSRDRKFDLWVMDYEKKSWGKEYTIDITILGEIYVDVTEVIGLWKEDEILFRFHTRDYNLSSVMYWSYSMRTGIITECEDLNFKARVFSLRGSLISLSGATEVS